MIPAVFGLSALTLGTEEAAFFRDVEPAGYILFGRNIDSREQLRALTDSLRALHGREDVLILIDQEGGRVQRMAPPVWPRFPSGETFDHLYEKAPATAIEAARTNARALGATLREVGINITCLPLLDVRQPEADNVIGDRALGHEPLRVAALGRAILDGLESAGTLGVVKHMPGHGRTRVDTHKAMPTVTASAADLETDLAPFRALNEASMGMTGHLLFTAWDADNPATLSEKIVRDIIRGAIGFDGLLFTDDLDMDALSGTVPERAERAVAAGCDIALNCWAKMDDMAGIAERLPDMRPDTVARIDKVREQLGRACEPQDIASLIERRDALIAAA